jgi:hypothetical protein
MNKTFTTAAALAAGFLGLASAQAAIGGCYEGVLSRPDGTQAPVVLRGALNEAEAYYWVHQFSIGSFAQIYSGALRGENTLRFNSNDDYIPGGNASYNADSELVFDASGERASGTFRHYRYASADGRGGFGQAGGVLVDSGEFALKRCAR